MLWGEAHISMGLLVRETLKFIRPRPNRHKPEYELPIQCNITATKA